MRLLIAVLDRQIGESMAHVKVLLKRLVQDSQDYGSDDEHMVSRVFFDLEVDGARQPDLYADLKQAVGGDSESSLIEVSAPVGYRGPLNYNAFRDGVERYYRGLVGAQGSGIRIQGASDVRMRDNEFIQPGAFEFDVEGAGGGW